LKENRKQIDSEFYLKPKKKVFLQNINVCILKENTIVVKRLMFDGDFRAECALTDVGGEEIDPGLDDGQEGESFKVMLLLN